MRKSLRVIVVDDQADVAESTGKLLSLDGHDVEVFTSAQSVLDALNRFEPDLILCDIGMPRMNGCELAVRIKERPECAHIVLAAVTGLGDDDYRQAIIEAGFDYRFIKPMRPDELQHFAEEISKNCH